MTCLRPVVALCASLTLSCSAPDDGAAPNTGSGSNIGGAFVGGAPSAGGASGSGDSTSTGGTATSAGAPGTGGAALPPGRARCAPPPGASAPPDTIDAVVMWLNALPKPTSTACFLESLPRPLALVATNSQFSAQPAFSDASPRVFIEVGRLWISAVIDGEASYLLEFGERPPDSELTSIKGEIALPLSENLSSNAPYERVRYGEGTMCAFCHRSEQPMSGLAPDAFVSDAIRPRPETRISIASLQAEHASCDWSSNAHRCEMLSALFDGGPVHETSFPDTMATFF